MIPFNPGQQWWGGFYEATIIISEMEPDQREISLLKFTQALRLYNKEVDLAKD